MCVFAPLCLVVCLRVGLKGLHGHAALNLSEGAEGLFLGLIKNYDTALGLELFHNGQQVLQFDALVLIVAALVVQVGQEFGDGRLELHSTSAVLVKM